MKYEVGINDFVRRHTPDSGKSFMVGMSFTQLAEHASGQMKREACRPGYRDGVILVEVDPDMVKYFRCPLVKIDEDTPLETKVVRRRDTEEPYIQIRALSGELIKAGKVELVLYRHDVLAENDEQTTDKEWELISILAIPEGLNKLPMGPVTMMRNQLKLPGGTAAEYSSGQWAESVRFWQKYAAKKPDEDH